jgi:putative PIN family toxin of toxin-antitoxin system
VTNREWVIDTNVLISAALSSKGVPALLVRFALSHRILVFSPPTFEELKDRLYRPKFDPYLTLEARQRILHDFSASAHWVDIGEPAVYCRDRNDDKFFETALVAKAAVMITGDKDLLDAQPIEGLQVLTPLQAVTLFGV